MFLASLLPLMFRRFLSYFPLFLPVLIGTIIATATTSSIAVYSETLRNVGLNHAILSTDRDSLDLRLNFESISMSAQHYDSDVQFVDQSVNDYLSGFVEPNIRQVRSSTFLVDYEGEYTKDLDLSYRGSFHSIDKVNNRFEIIEGKFPGKQVLIADDKSVLIEAVALKNNADLLEISLGDTMIYRPYWEDEATQVSVKIVGIVQKKEGDQFDWENPALDRLVGEPTLLNTLPVLVDETILVDVLGSLFREMTAYHYWRYRVDVDSINPRDAGELVESFDYLKNYLSASMSVYRQETQLTYLLQTYDSKIKYIQVPIAVVLLLVTGMVLYTVMFLAILITRKQQTDESLLATRGATRKHLFFINLVQAATIGGISILIGPILARFAIAYSGYLSYFSELNQSGALPVSLTPEVYLYGGLGSLVSFLVLLIPGLRYKDKNLLEQRSSDVRPAQKSFIQRLNIDVFIAVLTLFFVWQIGIQGSRVSRVLEGEESQDLVLLFIPVLFLFSSSFLLLRIIPVAASISSKVLSSIVPVWFALALWQISRNPLHITRLILLLVLVAGLGSFAANFGGTLDKSYVERAYYSAGADARLTGVYLARTGPSVDFRNIVNNAEGVEDTALVLRQEGSFLGGPSGVKYELLGIDPSNFSDVSWWRSDFSNEPLEDLVNKLEPFDSSNWGIQLPENAYKIRIEVEPLESNPLSSLIGVYSDSNGRYFSVTLGSLEQKGSHFLTSELKAQPTRSWGRSSEVLEPKAPLTLLSIQIIQRSRSSGMVKGALFIDSIAVQTKLSDDWDVIDRMDSDSSWHVLDIGPMTRSDSFILLPEANGKSSRSLFTWGASSGFIQRGIFRGPETYQTPILVSPSILAELNQNVGSNVTLSLGTSRVEAKVMGVVDNVPTLDPNKNSGFIVANVWDLIRVQNLIGRSAESQPNEIWVTFDQDNKQENDLTALKKIAGTDRVVDRNIVLTKSKADPLIAAGWETILAVSYLSVLFLGVVGYVSHAILTVGERRNQFALLRTLGITSMQIKLIVWVEHIMVILIGMVAGFFIGQKTGSLLMPFLDRTEEGVLVQPPFILDINWEALSGVYVIMIVFFTISTMLVVKIYNKMALAEVLRIGED